MRLTQYQKYIFERLGIDLPTIIHKKHVTRESKLYILGTVQKLA